LNAPIFNADLKSMLPVSALPFLKLFYEYMDGIENEAQPA